MRIADNDCWRESEGGAHRANASRARGVACLSAVDNQEYTRARDVVQALEAREESSATWDKQKNNNANEKKKDGLPVIANNAIVTLGWSCRLFKKTTPFKPASCICAGHDVRQHRKLKEEGRISANGSLLGSGKE